MKSLTQKGRLIRLVRWAGRLRDVVLAWPATGIHVAAGTFEERELDAGTEALLAAFALISWHSGAPDHLRHVIMHHGHVHPHHALHVS